MTDAREIVRKLLEHRQPPAWVLADITACSEAERQAAVARVVAWLAATVVAKPCPEYEPDYDGRRISEADATAYYQHWIDGER